MKRCTISYQKLLLVVLSSAILLMHSTLAADVEISIAGEQMRLGMAREPLLARLRSKFRVTEVYKNEHYGLMSQKKIDGGINFSVRSALKTGGSRLSLKVGAVSMERTLSSSPRRFSQPWSHSRVTALQS
jgi:hypothetical protein